MEDDERKPPTPADAARRVVALTAVLLRLDVEQQLAADRRSALRAGDELAAWLTQERIAPMLSPAEATIVTQTPVGELGEEAAFNLSCSGRCRRCPR
jgi:hypothetical protein